MSNEKNLESFAKLQDFVAEAAKGLKYGTIEIQFHDGVPTQVERKERKRLLNSQNLPSGHPRA